MRVTNIGISLKAGAVKVSAQAGAKLLTIQVCTKHILIHMIHSVHQVLQLVKTLYVHAYTQLYLYMVHVLALIKVFITLSDFLLQAFQYKLLCWHIQRKETRSLEIRSQIEHALTYTMYTVLLTNIHNKKGWNYVFCKKFLVHFLFTSIFIEQIVSVP